MKKCKTCCFKDSSLCALHTTFYNGNVEKSGTQSKIEFIGTEMIEVAEDFGCIQHKSNRKIEDITNEEFLVVCGRKTELMEDYKFNQQNMTFDEYISLEKKKFVISIINPSMESEQMYFKNALRIYFKLCDIGIDIIY